MASEMIVSTRKGLFTVKKNGKGWQIAPDVDFLGDNVTVALHDPRSGFSYAALDHGHFGVKLHRNKGDGWEEIAAPAYPEKPDDVVSKDGWGKDLPWAMVLIWALETGGPDEPGVIWCGTIPGGLFKSEDHGETWELNRPLWDEPKRQLWFGGGRELPGIHSICVDPRSSKTIRLGVSCGGVWQSDDGGKTWACRADGMRADFLPPEQQSEPYQQDPHFLVQSKGSPDRLWVQHHNGIFISSDGSKSWSEITNVNPSSFGFGVAVHPKEPDMAWFVPGIKDELRIPKDGQLVVTRTRDGGKSFDVLRKGLPQSHAYDLVLRHALAIDESGDQLAFGSTTGSLYVTEDQGDTWQALSQSLPPVYAVRFA
jgi:hypothetical protein